MEALYVSWAMPQYIQREPIQAATTASCSKEWSGVGSRLEKRVRDQREMEQIKRKLWCGKEFLMNRRRGPVTARDSTGVRFRYNRRHACDRRQGKMAVYQIFPYTSDLDYNWEDSLGLKTRGSEELIHRLIRNLQNAPIINSLPILLPALRSTTSKFNLNFITENGMD